ncbi:MAG: hypothetical protein LIO70_02120 [Clostridiales bacterium]|nr:hypothetical protein [Clostridiales bacterium]
MAEVKKGRQPPTQAVTLPYEVTHVAEAVALYNETGRTAHRTTTSHAAWERLCGLLDKAKIACCFAVVFL